MWYLLMCFTFSIQCCEFYKLGSSATSGRIPRFILPWPCTTQGHWNGRRDWSLCANWKLWQYTGCILRKGECL